MIRFAICSRDYYPQPNVQLMLQDQRELHILPYEHTSHIRPSNDVEFCFLSFRLAWPSQERCRRLEKGVLAL
jgi:hypothetical protein